MNVTVFIKPMKKILTNLLLTHRLTEWIWWSFIRVSGGEIWGWPFWIKNKIVCYRRQRVHFGGGIHLKVPCNK